MSDGRFYESDYEEAFVHLLQHTGWTYTCGDSIHRKLNEVLLENDLKEYLNFHRQTSDDDVYIDYIDFEDTTKNIFRCAL